MDLWDGTYVLARVADILKIGSMSRSHVRPKFEQYVLAGRVRSLCPSFLEERFVTLHDGIQNDPALEDSLGQQLGTFAESIDVEFLWHSRPSISISEHLVKLLVVKIFDSLVVRSRDTILEVVQCINLGAADLIKAWSRSGGQLLLGLLYRRARSSELSVR